MATRLLRCTAATGFGHFDKSSLNYIGHTSRATQKVTINVTPINGAVYSRTFVELTTDTFVSWQDDPHHPTFILSQSSNPEWQVGTTGNKVSRLEAR